MTSLTTKARLSGVEQALGDSIDPAHHLNKLRARKFIPILAVSIAVTACLAVVTLYQRCPVELTLTSRDLFDEVAGPAGTRMYLAAVRVHNRRTYAIEFDKNTRIEVKIANRWVQLQNYWSTQVLGRDAEETLLVPADAEACRFRLNYRRMAFPKLPLGLRDTWARYYAPSRFSWRVQQATSFLSKGLYDWLWPTNFTSTFSSHDLRPASSWRATTAEVPLLQAASRAIPTPDRGPENSQALQPGPPPQPPNRPIRAIRRFGRSLAQRRPPRAGQHRGHSR